MSDQRTCIPGRICGGGALFDEIERLTAECKIADEQIAQHVLYFSGLEKTNADLIERCNEQEVLYQEKVRDNAALSSEYSELLAAAKKWQSEEDYFHDGMELLAVLERVSGTQK